MTRVLDAARYARARELFHAAAELDAGERLRFLADACGSDVELLGAVRDLLEAAAGDDPLPSGRELRASLLGEHADPSFPTPERIGPYRVLGRIGRGGMAQVFEAEQDQPRRRVAVKVIQPEWVSPRRVRRFDDEVELLGRLRHENVARIYDSGEAVTPAGRVRYFVMERIDGRPLTDWVAAERPDVARRLRVFLGACRGVAEAHRRGIIHRDLKPENVLVDADGTAKVLDFGIARLLSREPDVRETRTRAGELLGTLRYMSPEQLHGEPDAVDTRSDVWSLGVVLFELLTGELPDPARTPALAPAPPRRLRQVRPDLPRELDVVLSTALAEAPEDRYQSVDAFAADLEAFLEHRPLRARPPGPLRRVQLFARRQRRTFLALVALAAVLVGAVALVVAFALRAEDARAEAVRANAATELEAYRANLAAASAALEALDAHAARDALDRTATHLRGWEWSHLAARLDGSALTLRGHANQVWDAAFSSDGSRLFTVGGAVFEPPGEQAVRAWDPATGAETWARTDLPDEPLFVAVGPDDRWIATSGGARDATLHVLDAASGAVLGRSVPPPSRPAGLVHVGAGRLLAVDVAGRLLAWRVSPSGSPRLEAVLRDDLGTVTDLALGPRHVHVSTRDLGTWTLDRTTGATVSLLSRSARSVAVSPDGASLALGHGDGLVELFDLTGPEARVVERVDQRAEVFDLAFTQDGRTLLTAGHEQVVRAWDVATGRTERPLVGHVSFVHRVVPEPGGERVVTCSHDGTARLWPAHGSTWRSSDPARPFRRVRGLAAPREGSLWALVSFDGELQVRRATDDALVAAWLLAEERVHAVALAEHAGLVACDQGNVVEVRALGTGEVVRRLEGHAGRIHALALDPEGRRLASASIDGTCRVWELTTGASLATIVPTGTASDSGPESPHGRPLLWDVAWSPDGEVLATADAAGRVFVWALGRGAEDGDPLAELVLDAAAWRLAWSPEGGVLGVGDQRGGVHSWRWREREDASLVQRHLRPVLGLVFTRDGRRLLSGSGGGILGVVEVASGQELATLRALPEEVWTMAWRPGGEELLVGCAGGLEVVPGGG